MGLRRKLHRNSHQTAGPQTIKVAIGMAIAPGVVATATAVTKVAGFAAMRLALSGLTP